MLAGLKINNLKTKECKEAYQLPLPLDFKLNKYSTPPILSFFLWLVLINYSIFEYST